MPASDPIEGPQSIAPRKAASYGSRTVGLSLRRVPGGVMVTVGRVDLDSKSDYPIVSEFGYRVMNSDVRDMADFLRNVVDQVDAEANEQVAVCDASV